MHHIMTFALSLLMLTGAVVAAPGDAASPVHASQAARFKQEKALAHMQELEQRMFRLAELIREEQPEEAAKLLMGIRKARDELITQRMREVSEQIRLMQYREAGEQQQAIVALLEELKLMLLTDDLDMQLKLEQLAQLKAAIEALDDLIEREQTQLDQTGESPDPLSDEALRKLLEAIEQRNARAAEGLAGKIGKIMPEVKKAGEQVGEAGKDMQQAAGNLNQNQPGGAAEKQGDAIRKMQEARNQLNQARQDLKDQLEPVIRKQVMQNLKAMLEQQIAIRETAERLTPRVTAGDGPAGVAFARLGREEDKIIVIADQTIDLAQQGDFSLTLPPALATVRDRMIYAADELRLAHAGESLTSGLKQIEKELELLIGAMEQSNKAANAPAPPQPQAGEPQPPDPRELNKLLAEVRILRIMEVSVHEQTTDVETDRQAGRANSRALAQRTRRLRERQEEIRTATAGLDKRMKEQQRP